MTGERGLLRCEGYCELEMWEDAREAWERLDDFHREGEPGLYMRLRIAMGAGDWAIGHEVAARLAMLDPELEDAFLHGAYCLHELKQTQAAREFLLSGPAKLREGALFYYNLACYEAVLGRIEEAQLMLDRAVELDAGYSETAREDPDLADLFGGLE